MPRTYITGASTNRTTDVLYIPESAAHLRLFLQDSRMYLLCYS